MHITWGRFSLITPQRCVRSLGCPCFSVFLFFCPSTCSQLGTHRPLTPEKQVTSHRPRVGRSTARVPTCHTIAAAYMCPLPHEARSSHEACVSCTPLVGLSTATGTPQPPPTPCKQQKLTHSQQPYPCQQIICVFMQCPDHHSQVLSHRTHLEQVPCPAYTSFPLPPPETWPSMALKHAEHRINPPVASTSGGNNHAPLGPEKRTKISMHIAPLDRKPKRLLDHRWDVCLHHRPSIQCRGRQPPGPLCLLRTKAVQIKDHPLTEKP